MILVKLKQSPMSSQWRFCGIVKGFRVFVSRNLRTYYERDGVWYKVKKV